MAEYQVHSTLKEGLDGRMHLAFSSFAGLFSNSASKYRIYSP